MQNEESAGYGLHNNVIVPNTTELYTQECLREWVLLISKYGDAWVSQIAQLVKNPPAMQETSVQSLGWEAPMQKG